MAPRNNRVNPASPTRGAARSFVQVLDGYYSPMQPTGPDKRKQEAFQRGLSQLSGIAEGEAQKAQEERREDLYNQGMADEVRERAGEELKGVKQGNILRQNSRFYQMGLNESRGKSAAIKWKNDLRVEFEQSGIDEQKNPEAFRAWMNQKTSEFLQQFEGNESALAGAMPTVTEVSNNFAASYSQRLNENLKEESFNAFSTEVKDIFDSGLYKGKSEDEIIAQLKEVTDDFYNLEGGAANQAMVQAVIDYANVTNDVVPLGVLAKAVDKGTIKLNPALHAAIGDAMDAQESQNNARENRMDKAEKDRVEKLSRQASSQFLTEMMSDPSFDLQTWFIESGTAEAAGEYKSKVFSDLLKAQNDFLSAEQASAENRNAASKETLFYNFRVEYASAPVSSNDPLVDTKADIIAKYAPTGALSVDKIESYYSEVFEIASGTATSEHDFIKRKRNLFLKPLKSLAEDGLVSYEVSSEMTEMGTFLYDRYILEAGAGIDPTDLGALSELHEKARQETVESLYDIYGEDLISKATGPDGNLSSPTAAVTGVTGEITQRLDEQQQAREAQEAEAAAILQQQIDEAFVQDNADAINTAGIPQEPEQPQGREAQARGQAAVEPESLGTLIGQGIDALTSGGETPNVGGRGRVERRNQAAEEVTPAPELEELPDEPPQVPSEPLIEGALETDPEQLAAKPDTFYEEIMNRLTDGEDTRTSVSPSALVETGKRILGLDENSQAAAISNFLAEGGVNLDPRTTAWCAGYVNATLAQNGMDGTGRLNARSFMNWGQKVDRPQVGDVVVLWRESPESWKGHVGFFKGFDENGNVLILGGNQGNKVSVASYPSNRVLGFRRPPGVTTGGETQMASSINQLATRPTDFLPEDAYDQD